MIRFRVDCDPPTSLHHQKKILRRGNRLTLCDTPELIRTKQYLAILFRPHRPKVPLTGPLRLSINIHFAWLKGHTKTQKAALIQHKPTRPDCSNLAKTIEDALANLGFFIDDSQVCRLEVQKYHGPNPGITIEIEQLEALGG